MQHKIFLGSVMVALLATFLASSAFGQIEEKGVPISFSVTTRTDIQTVTMPSIDVSALLAEDSVDQSKGKPFRFGYGFDVDFNLSNSGTWETLPDGSRLWRLRISCPGAYSINLLYRDFWLPKGARMFIYSEDRSMVIGAFTEKNNKANGRFMTRPVKGDVSIVEYLEPADVDRTGIIAIRRVVHGYKDVFGWISRAFGSSGPCHINVNCPEGDDWADQKRSVAMNLLGNGDRWCSGSLVNNVREDGTQYWLSAFHCGDSNQDGELSASERDDIEDWLTMFNYEAPSCPDADGPTDMTVQGTIIRAANDYSDVLLVEIVEQIPPEYKVYYSGWDARDQTYGSAVGIHHPATDIKKITFYPDGTYSGYFCCCGVGGCDGLSHWGVDADDPDANGTLEGGSSGSPLFNPSKRIIGQATGGFQVPACNSNSWKYGKFFHDMDYGGSAATRLRDWLDPDNTGTNVLDGFDTYSVEAAILVVDRSGSMQAEVDGGPDTRFERAIELAKDDADQLFDDFPDVEIAVMSFVTGDGIVLDQGFTNNSINVQTALNNITQSVLATPLAEAMIAAADLLSQESSPLYRRLYVYTDGGENASVHDGSSPVAGHCAADGTDIPDNWEPDCDPSDNDPACDDYQVCLGDALIDNGIVYVHYFGAPISKQGNGYDLELPSQSISASGKAAETSYAVATKEVADTVLPEFEFLKYVSKASGGVFNFDADENQPPIASCNDITVYADSMCEGYGTINNGSYDPDGDPVDIDIEPSSPYSLGVTDVTLIVTDPQGLADTCQGTVTVVDTISPVCFPPNDTTFLLCEPEEICLPVSCTDNCPDPTITIVSGPGAIVGDNWCYTPPGNGSFDVTIHCEDSSGNFCEATFNVTIWMAKVQIAKTHETLQGQHEYVPITFDGLGFVMGGFDILIAYDRSALNFQTVVEGDLYDQCDWEYFTYRTWFWPSYEPHFFWAGIVRVIGIADLNNGLYHPSCFTLPTPFALFTLDFLVTDNRLFECQFVPINFFWTDCGDNAISSITGDTLYIDRRIYDFAGSLIWDEEDDVQFPEDSRLPNVGVPDYCLNPDPNKPSAWRLLCFVNGGVDIICAESIDARADINLNGISNEIADAVVFTNYFIYGLGAFHVNVEGQIAATDVNADGLTLTVGDLVYLIRVIVGDALPYPKVTTPVAATYRHDPDGVLRVADGVSMGAVCVVVRGEVTPQLLAPDMELKYTFDGENTRMLVYSLEGHSFSGAFLRVPGEIVSIEMATRDGNPVVAELLPASFALHQNHPNPFNPSTEIRFDLPEAVNVTLEVYNILGQRVTKLVDRHMEAGAHEVTWDGSTVASGVYFYRITAGDFSDSRKMLLLK